MLKIDISKAISPRFGIYLLGIVPGLYFESSIALGQPHLAMSLISRVREIYPFGPFALLGMFLVSALFIGQGFFLLAWIVELLIASIFVIMALCSQDDARFGLALSLLRKAARYTP